MQNSLISLFIILFFSCSSYQLRTEDEKSIKLNYDFYLLEDGFVQFDVDYFIPYSKLIFNKKKNRYLPDVFTPFMRQQATNSQALLNAKMWKKITKKS